MIYLRGIAMVKIFGENKSPSKRSLKSKRKRSSKGLSNAQKELIGREMMGEVNPMAIALLSIHHTENPNNEWVSSTIKVINDKPHLLSKKWVKSINKWVENLVRSATLDPPEVSLGERVSLGPFSIFKILDPKPDSEWPSPAIICVDDRGWKWYFKSSKAYSFKKGEVITLKATVSCHKEGISFLKRAGSIKKTGNEIVSLGGLS